MFESLIGVGSYRCCAFKVVVVMSRTMLPNISEEHFCLSCEPEFVRSKWSHLCQILTEVRDHCLSLLSLLDLLAKIKCKILVTEKFIGERGLFNLGF